MTYCSDIKNEKARSLVRKFWSQTDNLHYDIDKLSFDNFVLRYKEIWKTLDKAVEIEGREIVVDISNLTDKARQKYGELFSNKYEVNELAVAV
jgi:hypothetical protein